MPRPTTIAWHGISLVVLKRGDRFVARIKDADSPARAGFKGLNWYAPIRSYRLTARWVPFKPRQVEEIPTVIGTTLKLPAPGLAVFLIGDEVLHLEPVVEDPAGKTLFFILRDETSKTTTYGGGRFLHTGLPDHGLDQPGSLMLDFNQLENPPCAYTVYATCPLPPEQNQLGIALEAGEQALPEIETYKRPRVRVGCKAKYNSFPGGGMRAIFGGKSALCLAAALVLAVSVPVCQAQSGSKADKQAQKIEKKLSKFKTGTLLHLRVQQQHRMHGNGEHSLRHVVYLQQFGYEREGDPSLQRCFKYEKGKEYIGAGSAPKHHIHIF